MFIACTLEYVKKSKEKTKKYYTILRRRIDGGFSEYAIQVPRGHLNPFAKLNECSCQVYRPMRSALTVLVVDYGCAK
jgi:hypothetical protein